MAGTYWIGFKPDTSPESAMQSAVEMVRKGDPPDLDEITAGPDVIHPKSDGDQLQVRIVTGIPDPRVDAVAAAVAEDEALRSANEARRVAPALTQEHLSALDKLVQMMKESG